MLAFLALLLLLLNLLAPGKPYRRKPDQPKKVFVLRRKPEWVRREVIRLKAQLREAGTCRTIAALFNRRFAKKNGMTVGHTFVCEVIRTAGSSKSQGRRRMRRR